jgi:MFS transporter, putative metabolite:H+ symporter
VSSTVTSTAIGARLDGLPLTRRHLGIAAIVGVGIFFDFYEVFLAGTLSAVLQRDFDVTGTDLKLVLASAFVGMFIGAITMGRVADRLGRRRAFFLTLSIYSFFTILAAFSPNLEMLILFRFLAGVGIGAELPVCDAYLADLMPKKVRGKVIAFAYTIGFLGTPVCGFLARGIATEQLLGIDGWRWMFIFGAGGAVICWALRFALPESPRWLESVGRHDEADAIVRDLERAAGVPSPSPEDDDAHTPDTAAAPTQEAVEKARLSQLFSPVLRGRTVMIWVFQILQPLGYYGFGTLVPLVLAAKGYDIVTTLGFSAVTFIGYPLGSALSIPIMERLERRTILICSAGSMAVFGLFFGAAQEPWLIMALGFCYTAVSNVFSNGYHAYQGELYPTALRASGAGIAYAIGRLATAAMPFILLPFLDTWGSTAMFSVVAVAMVVLCIVVRTLGPRTTGRSVDVVTHDSQLTGDLGSGPRQGERGR